MEIATLKAAAERVREILADAKPLAAELYRLKGRPGATCDRNCRNRTH